MNPAKFQRLIDEFSPALLSETFRQHDFFKPEATPISINSKQFADFEQLGVFKELEDKSNVLVICSRALSPLNERAGRRAQYDISKKILKESPSYQAGIFVFYDGKGDFRMSLVYKEYAGTKVKYNTFRRFTHFVSKNQPNTTFFQQVAPFDFVKLAELKELFSVEKVTKEFFKQYYKKFLELLEDFEKNKEFQKILKGNQRINTPDFVKKLMGQIVFLYFVQKKGWLGVRPDAKWGSGDIIFLRSLFNASQAANKNYYNDYLEPLFYKALSTKRENDIFELCNCRIPFLNGGLFEDFYDWKNTKILIPNEHIGKLLDFLDQYNFTVDENTPSDQEISVDPEMLGKIFENLLKVKDRRSKGTYYTPREIVHYMCHESLIQYLVSGSDVPEGRIRKLLEIKDTDLSVIVEDKKKAELIKVLPELKEIAEKVDKLLRDIKIVDPAVGSGAFPMGMLNEISTTRHYLNTNFLHKKNLNGDELSLYDIKKETLENCIYGVDIDPGAVEIAKLRFWLALIVDFEFDGGNEPPVLPNLDYKIMQGNSLLEDLVIGDSVIKIKIGGQKVDKRTKEMKNLFEEEAQTKLFRDKSEDMTDKLSKLQTLFFNESDPGKKRALKKNIDQAEQQLIETAGEEEIKRLKTVIANVQKAKDKKGAEAQIEQINKALAELVNKGTKPFFLWRLHFADVFEEKGGFDVVIANPPYVDSENMTKNNEKFREILSSIYKTARGNWDLFIIFIERGLQLLRTDATITYIVPNKLVAARYSEKLRGMLLTKNILEIRDYSNVNVFKEVDVYPIVFLIQNNNNRNDVVMSVMQSETELKLSNKVPAEVFYKDIHWGKYFSPKAVLDILLKMSGFSILGSLSGGVSDAATVSEAYQIKEHIVERSSRSKEGYKKLINTGSIDRYISYWGKQKTQYIKNGYLEPIIFDKGLKKISAVRFRQAISEKIIIAGMSKELECFYDTGEYLAGKSTTIILKDNLSKGINLKYIFALLNSNLVSFWFQKSFGALSLAGGYLQINNKEIEKIPTPAADDLIQKKFITLADKILVLTKSDDYLKNSTKQAKVRDYEKQIDQLVYTLYDLTTEEIKIVEGNK